MDSLVLVAKERKEAGKTVAKRLRNAGHLPAVMYNTKGEATMLDIDEVEFTKIWKVATPTTLINLDVDGKKSLAFIKDTEYDIKTDKNLHVDFHVIDESKKLKRMIRVQVSGSPVGVREGGVFVTGVKEIEIECLPKDLPVRLVVDVSALTLGASMAVKDIQLPNGMKVLSDGDAVVAQVRSIK